MIILCFWGLINNSRSQKKCLFIYWPTFSTGRDRTHPLILTVCLIQIQNLLANMYLLVQSGVSMWHGRPLRREYAKKVAHLFIPDSLSWAFYDDLLRRANATPRYYFTGRWHVARGPSSDSLGNPLSLHWNQLEFRKWIRPQKSRSGEFKCLTLDHSIGIKLDGLINGWRATQSAQLHKTTNSNNNKTNTMWHMYLLLYSNWTDCDAWDLHVAMHRNAIPVTSTHPSTQFNAIIQTEGLTDAQKNRVKPLNLMYCCCGYMILGCLGLRSPV